MCQQMEQFDSSEEESSSLGAATEKWRAAVSTDAAGRLDISEQAEN